MEITNMKHDNSEMNTSKKGQFRKRRYENDNSDKERSEKGQIRNGVIRKPRL